MFASKNTISYSSQGLTSGKAIISGYFDIFTHYKPEHCLLKKCEILG